MRLDLREIINVPGGSVPFDYEIDLSGLEAGSVTEIKPPSRVSGRVFNEAGMLLAEGVLSADMTCVCARCLKVFSRHADIPLSASIADGTREGDVGEDSDAYLLDGNFIDIDEIARTAFVLSTDQRLFCREDCRGLCPRCGKDLNDGPCSCGDDQDPRLAVLGQLLEK